MAQQFESCTIPHGDSQLSIKTVQKIHCLLLSPMSTKHVHGVQTDMHAKHLYT